MMRAEPEDERAARLAERRARLSPELQSQLAQRLRPRDAAAGAVPVAGAAPSEPWVPSALVAIQPSGRRPPFFCVHPAGGDVLCFQALSRHLGPEQPFYGLQSRGLEAGDEPLATIEEMAAAYRAEMSRITPGPYHLGGWSLGGVVAFELARQLAEAGSGVALLAIVDSTPGGGGGHSLPPPFGRGFQSQPSLDFGGLAQREAGGDSRRPGPGPTAAGAAPDDGKDRDEDDEGDDARWLMDIADYLERLWGVELGLTHETLRALPPESQALRFLAAMKRTSFGAAGATLEQLHRLLRVFKANVRAFKRYRPRPYPGPITLFRVAAAAGEPDDAAAFEPTLGWGALSPWPVEVEIVPGDHISALAEPHVRILAERLAARIGDPPG
jgi:thioesterase domain-containing protein